MPEHQQIQQSKKPNTSFQKQATPVIQTPLSNPYSIIQRAKINPKSLTHADVMQLQRAIGNRAVAQLLSGIVNSSTAHEAPIQRSEIPEEEEKPMQGKFETMQRSEIPKEAEPLQGKMIGTVQRQEIPEEEPPMQGKFESIQRQEIPQEEEKCPSCMQRQENPEEEEPLQGKMIETVQRQETLEEEKPLQGKFENNPGQVTCPSCFASSIVQKQESEEEEKPLQGKMIGTIQRQEIPDEKELLQTKKENNTGMPDNLKAGVESLSGIDMSDVRVHYDSSKPTEVGALAYTQGTNIHVAPEQERHLPHEAWHVVQQAQGRVRPTMQLKGVAVNDDVGLEREADIMGGEAMKIPIQQNLAVPTAFPIVGNGLIQRVVTGVDPLIGCANPADHSLLYGLHPFRQLTQGRVVPQDARLGVPKKRTIDEYNGDVGINGLMTANQSAVGIFTVREALNDHLNWNNYFPGTGPRIAGDPNLGTWIQKLANNRLSIGLNDFGDRTKEGFFGFRKRRGLKKIMSKSRFTKNLGDPALNHADHIRPQDINRWLDSNRTAAQALNLAQAMPPQKLNAINQWVYKAFFRRTSKLGIDFATGDLLSMVHFNTASAIDHRSPNPALNMPREDGLILNGLHIDQSHNRSITISEYRHIQKQLNRHAINPARVNFYGEY